MKYATLALAGFILLLLALCLGLLRQPGLAQPALTRSATQPLYQVDLNQAEVAELALLPGVGPALAQTIVTDRQTNGPFRQAQDVRRVQGIGAIKWQNLQPYVTCGPSPETTRQGSSN